MNINSVLSNVKNIIKFDPSLLCLKDNSKIFYRNNEYIISKDNNLISKKLSDSCINNKLNKDDDFNDKFAQVKDYFIKNPEYFLNKFNFKSIDNIIISKPDHRLERVNAIVTIYGKKHYNKDEVIKLNFYIKDISKSPEVNILSAKQLTNRSLLKRINVFYTYLAELESNKFNLFPRSAIDIFKKLDETKKYLKNHIKTIITSIIPNADYLLNIDNKNNISFVDVSELITRYTHELKKSDNEISLCNKGIKILSNLFSICSKGSGSHPEYFKICINKNVFKKLEEMRADLKSNRSIAGANAAKNGKDYEKYVADNFYIRDGIPVNDYTIFLLGLLKIDYRTIHSLTATRYKNQKIKPDIFVEISFKTGESLNINLSAKSQGKSGYGHLSGHTYKSFKELFNIINPITNEVENALKMFQSVRQASLLSMDDMEILKKYFQEKMRDIFKFAFIHGNKKLNADFILCYNKSKNTTKIFSILNVLDYYLKESLLEVDFKGTNISLMNGLILLEARSKGLQLHFNPKKLIEKLD